MRLERISVNQFKIFITYDDLLERGYSKEDLWNNIHKANELFQDMLHEASEELDIDLDGILNVRVHMLQAQGMIIVVTQSDDIIDEEYIELKVTMDESKELMFKFDDFEHVIQVAKVLDHNYKHLNLIVFHFENVYFVVIKDEKLTAKQRDNIISIFSEYGSPSTMNSHVLYEYGDVIIEEDALNVITKYF